MRDFKKYDVWIKPHDLALMGYKEIAPLFPKTEQFTLINQMKRAAYCVPFNNAEECGRNTDKDFVHFLNQPIEPVQEFAYCFLPSKNLDSINNEKYSIANERLNEIKAKLIHLIKSIRGNSN